MDLDDMTIRLLVDHDGADLYRKWLLDLRDQISRLEGRVNNFRISHQRLILGSFLKTWWTIPLIIGLFILTSNQSATLGLLIGPGASFSYIIAFLALTLALIIVVPSYARDHALAEFELMKERNMLRFLRDKEDARLALASAMKVAAPYLKERNSYRQNLQRLSEIRTLIGKYSLTISKRNDQRRGNIPTAVKQAVWTRDSGECQGCGSKKELHFDHIIPISKGGSNAIENLQLLCARCNLAKSDKIQ